MEPIRGKTYSLSANGLSNAPYYQTLRSLADACLKQQPELPRLLEEIRSVAQNKRRLRAVLRRPHEYPGTAHILEMIREPLSGYITGLTDHLSSISPMDRFSPALSMTKEQYLLAMLEIELMNRLHREEFLHTRYRIALLPHCLHDLSRSCDSAMADLDYVCRRCSENCYIHRASDILAHARIRAYIWMTRDFKKMSGRIWKSQGRFAVLGIACIPELVRGMRMCMRYNLPVAGVPLDANRCRRWMGSFHPNSVNLSHLSALLDGTEKATERHEMRG